MVEICISATFFHLYLFFLCDRRDLVEYCIKQEMLMQRCVNM